MSEIEFELVARRFAAAEPQLVLRWALEKYDSIGVSFSGAEDVVLVEMASVIRPGIQVFSLDTGRLHPETYRLIEEVRERYDIEHEMLYPDTESVQELVRHKGLYSFFRDGHSECCGIRKVEPLRRKLNQLEAWVTGQRQDQSLTRAQVPVVQIDAAFSSGDRRLVKINPLAAWTSAQVWSHIRTHGVPYNALHERGFVSIGCEPCTRAVLPNQHEREGRWWWENAADKECGLHAANAASNQ